jgi:hypothetical protein
VIVPAWLVAEAGTWVNPSSLISALVIPQLRAAVRVARSAKPAYMKSFYIHDTMSGLALPSFVVLCLLPIAPSLREHLETPHLFLAGLLGIVFVVSEIVSSGKTGTPH